MIGQAAVVKVKLYLKDAVSKGAKVLLGGKPSDLGGTFFEPPLLTEVTQDMDLAHEKTFGPLAPLLRFETEQEVLAIANDTEFGLAS